MRLSGEQVVTMTGETEKSLLERLRGGFLFERGRSAQRKETALLQDGDAAREQFDFGEGM